MSTDDTKTSLPKGTVPADAAGIGNAIEVLRNGGLVAFPTETVYGLGADARDERAVARIFAAKGRPSFNPLIVHVKSTEAVLEHAEMDERAHLLARHFWPGALTLVLKRRDDTTLSKLVSAGLDSVAMRVPDHNVSNQLLGVSEIPLAAPSANRSGKISPTQAHHVSDSLGQNVDLILDGGPTEIGVESTILDLSDSTKVTLLRPGGVSAEEIEAVLDSPLATTEAADDGLGNQPRLAPGLLKSHYAPSASVRLNATEAEPGELLIGFGEIEGTGMTLSATGDLLEAAANLFSMLHRADTEGHVGIAVAPIPHSGLGLAINDRLKRASAPRDLPE